MIAKIETSDELREWLQRHHVHGFAIGAGVRTIQARPDGAKQPVSITVTEQAMRGLDAEIVWQHDPSGDRLPKDILFALQSQLTGPKAGSLN